MRLTHGKKGSKVYTCWHGIKKRCLRPSNIMFHHYGERGITICPEWMDFTVFYADMGDPPGPEYSIERIDNNLGYCKSNCKWATPAEQSRNRRVNIWVSHEGKTLILKDWATLTGIKYWTLQYRYGAGRRGIDLFAPVRREKGESK